MNNANMPACIGTKIQFVGKLNANTMEVRTLVQSHTDWLMTTFFMERSSSSQQEELIAGVSFCQTVRLIFYYGHYNKGRRVNLMGAITTLTD
jgi:hypothetical protein